jgi:hypothetical protein
MDGKTPPDYAAAALPATRVGGIEATGRVTSGTFS